MLQQMFRKFQISNLLPNRYFPKIGGYTFVFPSSAKRAKLPCRDLVLFYATCIRSILVYVAPVFFHALPKYSHCERVQKKALSIICPSLSYDEALNEAGIPTIISYYEDICDKVFNTALGNKDNKLNKLLTETNKAPYLLRNHRHFALPKWKTDRFKNTFILSSCLKYN